MRRSVSVVFKSAPGSEQNGTLLSRTEGAVSLRSVVQKSLNLSQANSLAMEQCQCGVAPTPNSFSRRPLHEHQPCTAQSMARHAAGYCPAFPGAVRLARIMVHVQICPVEACRGMVML